MADISGDAFLDFFASPSLSHAGSRFNSTFPATGSFATSQPPPDADNDDDDWGDFMGPPSGSYPASDFDLAPSNGFSSNPPPRSTSTVFDPFHFADSGSAGFVEPESNRIGSDSKGIVFEKPRGPLPLSLFGFEEEEKGSGGEEADSVVNLSVNGSDVSLHQKSSQDVVNGYSDFKLGASEILANLYAQTPPIEHRTGLISDTNGLDSVSKSDTSPNGANEVSDDEDDWEFHGAVSGDGVEDRDFKGGPEVSESKGETTSVISQDKKAGQDPSKFAVTNPELMNSPLQFADLFTSQNGISNKTSEVNGGTDLKATSFFPDAFMSFPVANDMENGNANVTYPSQNGVSNKNSEVNGGTDLKATSFFPDAFMSFPVANDMKNGNANVTYPTPENTNDDFDDFGEFMDASSEPLSEYQDHRTKPESNRQPFPESIFSNGTVDSNEGHQNVTYEATFVPRNGTSIQGSEKSIHDIISNLYTQDQHGPLIDSGEKTVENGSSTILKTLDSSSVNSLNYSDKSWDFKEEVGGVEENSSDVVQKGSIKLQDLQLSVDFFARLRDKLHLVASCLLEEAENSEAQEAHKALQDDMGSEIYLEKSMPINGCLNDFIEVLNGPTFQKIEPEFLLPRELLSAEKDWKVAIKLLKESKLIVKILESGSPDDQSAYFSTWCSIVNVCAEELRHGALIWKQAVENNLQIQILSDHRGQRYIHSLGEIYRVIQLLGLSAKVYKPWMLFNKEDQSSLFLVLDECSALWSSSGLEEAFWNLLGSVDSVSGQSVEALVESFEHIQEIDVLAVQDCVFLQQRSVCQLSLLPEQMLPELKSVSWNGLKCFLKVANCWANLISQEPPCLPQLRVG